MKRGQNIIRIAAALLCASTSVFAPPAFASKKDNSVVFAFDQTLPNADPYMNVQLIGGILADQVWDTLIYRDPDSGAYKGNLATAWRWIDDKTLELELREGVKFHNGATFDADDVVFTFSTVSKPENRAVANNVRWIDHVEKLDKFKVQIVAKQPFPAAIAYLASPFFVVHPHDYYAKVGSKGMSERPIGSGPYRVVEHVLGKRIRLERNRDYFKGGPKVQPKIDKVEIRFIPDAQTRVAEIVAGGVDLIMRVDPDQAEQLRNVPSLKIVSADSSGYYSLSLNTRSNTPAPQLLDIRVRQAISHAIDRESIAKYITGPESRVLHSECSLDQFGCTDDGVPRYAYDPQKSKQLLAEAGYKDGFNIDLYAYRDRNQVEAVIGYLGAVGIRARLRFMQAGAILAAKRAGKLTLSMGVSNAIVDDISDSVSRNHEFSPDDINRDPEVRDLMLRGDSSIDPELRKASYAKALTLIAERAYVLPLYSIPIYYLVAKDLTLKPHSDNILRFYEMSW